jgi:acylphosphatase
MTQRVTINVMGRVQGVGFRHHTLKKAKELNICGFVRNEYDGSVFIDAEGQEEDINLLIEWCKKGPAWSKVERIQVTENELMNYKDFFID